MKKPSFQEEKKLKKKGYEKIAGLDEAGRGCLAGPVVAAAAIIDWRMFFQRRGVFKNVNDSKKLSPKKREELYKILTNHPAIEWGIGCVSEKVIDRINILEATKLAMEKAIHRLKSKPDFLILDGRMSLNLKTSQKSIVKADEKVFSCAAASIIAKVTRDRIMGKEAKKYPLYGFDKHKGYPTEYHRKMLKKNGSSKIHRKTFQPVKQLEEFISVR